MSTVIKVHKYEIGDVSFHPLYLGRNGTGFITGLSVYRPLGSDTLTLTPVNSKGIWARCFMEIPLVAIPEFIEALKKEAGLAC